MSGRPFERPVHAVSPHGPRWGPAQARSGVRGSGVVGTHPPPPAGARVVEGDGVAAVSLGPLSPPATGPPTSTPVLRPGLCQSRLPGGAGGPAEHSLSFASACPARPPPHLLPAAHSHTWGLGPPAGVTAGRGRVGWNPVGLAIFTREGSPVGLRGPQASPISAHRGEGVCSLEGAGSEGQKGLRSLRHPQGAPARGREEPALGGAQDSVLLPELRGPIARSSRARPQAEAFSWTRRVSPARESGAGTAGPGAHSPVTRERQSLP